jgi:hypothetical protein
VPVGVDLEALLAAFSEGAAHLIAGLFAGHGIGTTWLGELDSAPMLPEESR